MPKALNPLLADEPFLRMAALRLKARRTQDAQLPGAAPATPAWHQYVTPRLRVPHPEQARFLTSPAKRKVIRAGRRGGKAQPLTARVYTPTGPVLMGAIQVGDLVLTPDGGTSPVLAIYPQGVVDIYAVRFGDGTVVECTADHLWEICERRTDSLWKERSRVVTTAMLKTMPTVMQAGRGANRRPTIPPTQCVAYEAQYVPLDPYLLGVLIGDGTHRHESVGLHATEPHILARVAAALPPGVVLRRDRSTHDYRLAVQLGEQVNPVIRALKSLGLWGCYSYEKRIPACYRYNTPAVRLATLHGIFDTDGWVDHNGQPRLDQTSEQLARDVAEVTQSLGWLCTTSTKAAGYKVNGVYKPCHRVWTQAFLCPEAQVCFTLPAKREKARPRARPVQRFIQSVTPVGQAEAKCIQIADPRGLYLTDGLTATHNTVGVALIALLAFLAGKRVLYAVPTQEQIDRFWFEVKRALEPVIELGHLYKNETRHTIEVHDMETRIRAKTAWNADTLRGDYADVLILDEYQLMDEDAWGYVGAPMLLDNDGDAIFIYTPPSTEQTTVSKARDKRHAAKLFKAASQDVSGRWATFHFTSHANPYLSTQALAEIGTDMTSAALRQEIYAEELDEVLGALWSLATLDRTRVTAAQVPPLTMIGVALDPSATSQATSDEMGLIAGGRDARGHGYVLRDATARGTPAAMVREALLLYDALRADVLVAEVNNGGEWIGTVVAFVAQQMAREGERSTAFVNYETVYATRGKQTRAAPIAAQYEHNHVHHVGVFPELEEELTTWVPGMVSPNRLDATVWLFTRLLDHILIPEDVNLAQVLDLRQEPFGTRIRTQAAASHGRWSLPRRPRRTPHVGAWRAQDDD
jgi:LAGLIDADG-like domain